MVWFSRPTRPTRYNTEKLDKNMKSYSQNNVQQDLWVLQELGGKNNGFFIDFGAAHPLKLNNTYLFESDYGWEGISYDIGPPYAHECSDMSIDEYIGLWKSTRKTPIIVTDVLKIDIKKSFEDNNIPKIVDYLSLDLEPPTSTFQLLYSLPIDEYQFNLITFESDAYRGFDKERLEVINYLESKGYEFIKSVSQDDFFKFKGI
jgi:hypothetical protein